MQEEAGTPLTATEPSASTPPPATPEVRRRLKAVLLGLALVVLVLDQATKVWALQALTPGEKVDLLGSAISLNLIRNPGAAFSIGDGATWILTVVSIVILVWVVVAARKVGTLAWAVALGLLLGGALGNLVDRFFRAPGPGRGHVVDFIDYFGWFVGNVADIAIVAGAAIIMVLAYRGTPVAGPPHQPEHADV
ncbi:MAG: signal peptidase II [Dermatophilaceae bacterium]|jgi:signal peptidase II|nr:signal peptidase II [Dermatophilaceae bacterium]MBU9943234.1 signal peptidase II [Dermatophilaceae bacterium]